MPEQGYRRPAPRARVRVLAQPCAGADEESFGRERWLLRGVLFRETIERGGRSIKSVLDNMRTWGKELHKQT